MKTYKEMGLVIGSLIGEILAGICVYLQVALVVVYMVLLINLCSGYYIGSQQKRG